MNVLFEAYIGRILTRALGGTGFRFSWQGGHRDCLYESEIGRFRTRPDFIVRQSERIVLVIDAKGKRTVPRIEDPKQRISQAGVYQLKAYDSRYVCSDIVLLSPQYGDLPLDPVRHFYLIGKMGADQTLIVATQDPSGFMQSYKDVLWQLVLKLLQLDHRLEGQSFWVKNYILAICEVFILHPRVQSGTPSRQRRLDTRPVPTASVGTIRADCGRR